MACAAADGKDAVVVVEVAVPVGADEIFKDVNPIAGGFDVPASVAVELTDKEDFTGLGEENGGVEAAAINLEGVLGGGVAALADLEAGYEVAADGGAEGWGVGDVNGVAVGISDHKAWFAGLIKEAIDFDKGKGVGVCSAAAEGDVEGFGITEVEEIAEAGLGWNGEGVVAGSGCCDLGLEGEVAAIWVSRGAEREVDGTVRIGVDVEIREDLRVALLAG